MIKSQLYPYIEKYVGEYLWGFTKEQFNLGVMSGELCLDNLNFRPDKTNQKLDEHDIPLWIKAGQIEKIKICCSLMNFIGEKPIDIIIENINIILTVSNKWILLNEDSFILETETLIQDPYDGIDNNSHDIFLKKLNIYDTSSIKQKTNIIELFKDKNKFSIFINKIFSRAMKFYYQKPILLNLTIKNLNIRFEDDKFNFFGKFAFGVIAKSLTASFSNNGVIKKNNIKLENLDAYWEKNPEILIPTDIILTKLNYRESIIDESYYAYLKTISFIPKSEQIKILTNFSCIFNVGLELISTGNIDFFAKSKEKKVKCYFQVATSEVNLQIQPELIKKFSNLLDTLKSYYIIDSIQNFKPMRKPYVKSSLLVNKYTKSSKLQYKKKMVVRDWFYYFMWYTRFKKIVYGTYFKNPLQEEFSKYFNICCLPQNQDKDFDDNNNNNDNDNNSEIFVPPIINEVIDLNPENIHLVVHFDFLIKCLNLNFSSDKEDFTFIGTNPELRMVINSTKVDLKFNIKDLTVVPGNKFKLYATTEQEDVLKNIVFKTIENKSDNCFNMEQTDQNNKNKSNFYSPGRVSFKKVEYNERPNPHSSYKSIYKHKIKVLNEILNEYNFEDNKSSIDNKDSASKKTNLTSMSNLSNINITNNAAVKSMKIYNLIFEIMEDNRLEREHKVDFSLSNKLNESYKNYLKENYKHIHLSGNQNNSNKQTKSINYNHKRIGTDSNNSSSSNLISNTLVKSNNLLKSNDENKVKALNFIEVRSHIDSTGISIGEENFAVTMKIVKTRGQGQVLGQMHGHRGHRHAFDKISDSIKINFGKTRINIIDSYLIRYISLIKYFLKSLNSNNIKTDLINNDQEEIYKMRKYIYEKIKDEAIEMDIVELKNYLKVELDRYDDSTISDGKFHINHFFNELNFKEYEIMLNFNEIILSGIDHTINTTNTSSSSNNNKDKTNQSSISICKTKIPDVDLKFIMNSTKLYSKIFDMEIEYYKLSKWKEFLNNITSTIENKFHSSNGVEPMIRRFITEKKLLDLKKLMDNCPNEQEEYDTERHQFNNLNYIPNNNYDSDDNAKRTKRLNNEKKMNDLFKDSPATQKAEDINFSSDEEK